MKIPKSKYQYFYNYSASSPWNKILKELRTHSELSQEEVAQYLGVTRKTYGNYESGIAEIKIEAIRKLSELYGIPSSVIIGDPSKMIKFKEELKEDEQI